MAIFPYAILYEEISWRVFCREENKVKKILVVIFMLTICLTSCGEKQQEAPEITEPAEADSVKAEEPVFKPIEEETDEPDPGVPADTEDPVDIDDYIGYFTDDSYNDVTIEKNGNDINMSVSLYRLATMDEGTVRISSEGVEFDSTDMAGDPISFSFTKTGETYTLKVEHSTWEYLEEGTVYENMVKTAY
jgi:hypothetical protein